MNIAANKEVGNIGVPEQCKVTTTATSRQQSSSECKRAMNMFSYFSGWSNDDIEECCDLSKIIVFQPEETIFGDGFGQLNYVYFILDGVCRVMQNITTAVRSNKHVIQYRPYHQQMKLQPREKVEIFFVQVCLLHRKSVFGLGEDMQERRVIAMSTVTCLVVPNHWIMQHSRNDIWVRICQFFNRTVPTREEVLKAFLQQCNWIAYRQNLVQTVRLKKSMLNKTTINDVPYSIRIKNEAVPV